MGSEALTRVQGNFLLLLDASMFPVGTSCVPRNIVNTEVWGFLKDGAPFWRTKPRKRTRGKRHRNVPLQDLLKFPAHTEKLSKSRKCKHSNTRNTISCKPNCTVNQCEGANTQDQIQTHVIASYRQLSITLHWWSIWFSRFASTGRCLPVSREMFMCTTGRWSFKTTGSYIFTARSNILIQVLAPDKGCILKHSNIFAPSE